MATIAGLRDALKTRLQTIAGLRVHDTVPDLLTPPAAMIQPASLSSKTAMGLGRRVHVFEITLLAAPAGQAGIARAQDTLDPYLDETGTKSVIAALEGDVALGGTVSSLDVSWADYGILEWNDVPYVGAKFAVTVWP